MFSHYEETEKYIGCELTKNFIARLIKALGGKDVTVKDLLAKDKDTLYCGFNSTNSEIVGQLETLVACKTFQDKENYIIRFSLTELRKVLEKYATSALLQITKPYSQSFRFRNCEFVDERGFVIDETLQQLLCQHQQIPLMDALRQHGFDLGSFEKITYTYEHRRDSFRLTQVDGFISSISHSLPWPIAHGQRFQTIMISDIERLIALNLLPDLNLQYQKKQRLAFCMGTHKRLGKDSSITLSFCSSKLFDKPLVDMIMGFYPAMQPANERKEELVVEEEAKPNKEVDSINQEIVNLINQLVSEKESFFNFGDVELKSAKILFLMLILELKKANLALSFQQCLFIAKMDEEKLYMRAFEGSNSTRTADLLFKIENPNYRPRALRLQLS